MRLVSTRYKPWGLIYGLGSALGCSGGLWGDFQKNAKKFSELQKKYVRTYVVFFLFFFAPPLVGGLLRGLPYI